MDYHLPIADVLESMAWAYFGLEADKIFAKLYDKSQPFSKAQRTALIDYARKGLVSAVRYMLRTEKSALSEGGHSMRPAEQLQSLKRRLPQLMATPQASENGRGFCKITRSGY